MKILHFFQLPLKSILGTDSIPYSLLTPSTLFFNKTALIFNKNKKIQHKLNTFNYLSI